MVNKCALFSVLSAVVPEDHEKGGIGMKKRILALLLASFVMVSTMEYCHVDAYAVETAMTAAEWAYLFELGSAAAGVTYGSSAEASAFEDEWAGYISTQDGVTKYPGLDEKYKEKNSVYLDEIDEYGEKFSTKMLRSIVDFLKSDDVSSGYGTGNFLFQHSFTLKILDILGLSGESYLLDTVSEYLGVSVYSGMPSGSVILRYPVGYNTLLSQYDTYIITVREYSLYGTVVDGARFGIVGNVEITENKGLSFSYTAYNNPFSNNTISSGGTTGLSTYDSSLVAIYFSPGVTFTFPTGSGLADYIVEDSLFDFVFADSFPDVQAKSISVVPSLSDIFTIPTTAEERESTLAKVREADTTEALVKALADAGVVTGLVDVYPGTDIDVDTETYPWLGSIVELLTKIWTAIQAIPASIAVAIENVVVGQDSGNYKISDIVTDKFPFCIPFDLIHCFQVVQANPVAPVWKIPFVIDNQYIKYNQEITIDLTDWERPAVVIRYFILLIYIAGLVYATRYVIKG